MRIQSIFSPSPRGQCVHTVHSVFIGILLQSAHFKHILSTLKENYQKIPDDFRVCFGMAQDANIIFPWNFKPFH